MHQSWKIVCTISKKNGVAIEFTEKRRDWKISICKTDKLIEEHVLPRLSGGNNSAFFVVNGEFTRIENVNLVTGDFYNQFRDIVDCLFKSTTFVMENPKFFVRVDKGDVKLVNVGIAHIKDGQKRIVKNIKFLWLIGTNRGE